MNISELRQRLHVGSVRQASLKLLSEVSLVEVVIRSIRGVGLMGDADCETRQPLIDDLYDLLNRVAIKALDTQHSMQVRYCSVTLRRYDCNTNFSDHL